MSTHYRADIDGLRALAVIPVVFFHANIAGFDGGYVGVDIFFVISGYLITTIISNALAQGQFSLVNFYERRARRILPALFAVIAVTAIAALFLEAPKDLKNFGQSMVAATLFSSNILFFVEAGYFDQDSIYKPLLHTWSLGVEEQFYLIVPLLLMFVAARKLSPLWSILGISLVSFCLCVAYTPTYPEATFFLLPFRFWELGMGALLALIPLRSGGGLLNQLLAGFGLVCIVLSVLLFSPSTQFPGFWAFVPCLGAVLILATGARQKTLVSRALSFAPLVWVGLISYSLYLWHWPVIVLYRHYAVDVSGGDAPFLVSSATVLIILISLVLAVLSWRFVEQPFRQKRADRYRISARTVFAGSGLLALITVFAGAAMHVGAGWPGRFDRSLVRISDTIGVRPSISCLNSGTAQNTVPNLQEMGSSGPLKVALWGDSHAAHLTDGMMSIAENAGVRAGYYGVCGCPPLIGLEREDGKDFSCDKVNSWMLDRITSDPEIEAVVLATRFQLIVEGVGYGPLEAHNGAIKLRSLSQEDAQQERDQKKLVFSHLTQTISALQMAGKRVFVVYPAPEIGLHAPRAIFRYARAGGEPDEFVLPLDAYQERISQTVTGLDTVIEETGAETIRLDSVLCSDAGCVTSVDGDVLYRDGDHLTPAGSVLVGALFNRVFEPQVQ